MNVEFQIHGVLSNGQTQWKQNDQDYYTQFYSKQQEDVLMIVEIVKRPHGVSSYYNYLRSNNIVSTRAGSYFGMTLRIDDAFCQDVKSIFMIMDTIFNKMVVGNILAPVGENLRFTIDAFDAQNAFLVQLENQFFNMLNAFCAQQDFIGITPSSTSLQKRQNSNPFELTMSNAVSAIISNRFKLYLSPIYQSETLRQSIDNEIWRANSAVAEADKRIKAAENAKAQSEAQHQADRNKWLQERVALEKARDEATKKARELQSHVKNSNLNVSINEKIAEIKQPLTELTRLLATVSRPVSGRDRVTPPNPKPTFIKNVINWLPWGVCLLLAIATISYSGRYYSQVEKYNNLAKDDSTTINNLKTQIDELQESFKREECIPYQNPTFNDCRIDIHPNPVGGKLNKDTEYTLKLLHSGEPVRWTINDKLIRGNRFKPGTTYGDSITIRCINQDGSVIRKRSIEIK